jgi:hypothetical protein
VNRFFFKLFLRSFIFLAFIASESLFSLVHNHSYKTKNKKRTSAPSNKNNAKKINQHRLNNQKKPIGWSVFQDQLGENCWYFLAKGSIDFNKDVFFDQKSLIKSFFTTYQKIGKETLSIAKLKIQKGYTPFLKKNEKGKTFFSLQNTVPSWVKTIDIHNQKDIVLFKKNKNIEAVKLTLPGFDKSLLIFLLPYSAKPLMDLEANHVKNLNPLLSCQGIVFAPCKHYETKVENGYVKIVAKNEQKPNEQKPIDDLGLKKIPLHHKKNYSSSLIQHKTPIYEKVVDLLSKARGEETLTELSLIESKELVDDTLMGYYRSLAHLCRENFSDALRELDLLNTTEEIELLKSIAKVQEWEKGQKNIKLNKLSSNQIDILNDYPKDLRMVLFPWVAQNLYQKNQFALLEQLLDKKNFSNDPEKQSYFDFYQAMLAFHLGKDMEGTAILERLWKKTSPHVCSRKIKILSEIHWAKKTIKEKKQLVIYLESLRDKQKSNIFEWFLLMDLGNLYEHLEKPSLATAIYSDLISRFAELSSAHGIKKNALKNFYESFNKKKEDQTPLDMVSFYHQYAYLIKNEPISKMIVDIIKKITKSLLDLGLYEDASDFLTDNFTKIHDAIDIKDHLTLAKYCQEAKNYQKSLEILDEMNLESDAIEQNLLNDSNIVKAKNLIALDKKNEGFSLLKKINTDESLKILGDEYLKDLNHDEAASTLSELLDRLTMKNIKNEDRTSDTSNNKEIQQILLKLAICYRFIDDELGLSNLYEGYKDMLKGKKNEGLFNFLTSPQPIDLTTTTQIEEKIKSINSLIKDIDLAYETK